MRKFLIAFVLVLLALPVAAQQINIDFPDLEERAEEVVDVTLDASMLRLGAKFLRGHDPDERAVRDMIQGLTGIYVRSYEFSRENEYDKKLPDRIKSQLGPTWKAFVTVRSKTKDNVNIYADMRGDKVVGLVVIAAEPRELTIVNIVGPIDIERLADLEGEFGIPRFTVKGNGRGKDKDHD